MTSDTILLMASEDEEPSPDDIVKEELDEEDAELDDEDDIDSDEAKDRIVKEDLPDDDDDI